MAYSPLLHKPTINSELNPLTIPRATLEELARATVILHKVPLSGTAVPALDWNS